MRHPREEKTFVIIKPDGVKRGLSGEIIRRIEQRGLKIIALGMEEPNRKKIDGHYPKDKKWINRLGMNTLNTCERYKVDPKKLFDTNNPDIIGKKVRVWVINYMTSGPAIKMPVKGIHSVDMVRKMVGKSLPYLAEMGTIRGDFSVDSPLAANTDLRSIHNIIHASETPQEASHEIKYWFNTKEIHDYKRVEEDLML